MKQSQKVIEAKARLKLFRTQGHKLMPSEYAIAKAQAEKDKTLVGDTIVKYAKVASSGK